MPKWFFSLPCNSLCTLMSYSYGLTESQFGKNSKRLNSLLEYTEEPNPAKHEKSGFTGA